ncbi:hypothetical protein AK830_g3454 [Neonectria ditissima]|uniref:GP-PDE domain-containing protein n=1 Tax=Neonectria ditissima TaxID=78410 RepID=A0A0P7BRQ6_9HYPO|nr:hypothetical protein AK830_g3454 [Neonectria ditissima]
MPPRSPDRRTRPIRAPASSRDETMPLMKQAQNDDVPRAPWAAALSSPRDPTRRLPQAIAHRGAKALWPENTMAAFHGAVDVGAHALETDVHLSADGVVVLSHRGVTHMENSQDPTLKRCYGVDRKIADCDWEYLKTLRTVRQPAEPMPRLKDLLEWLAMPRLEKIWVLLDIKIDDNAEDLVGAIARTLKEVPGPVPWDQRIVAGCWNASFLKAARCLLPTHPLAHISASLLYSHHFLRIPNLGFNVNQKSLIGFPGALFLKEIQRSDKLLLTWTVNEPRWMEWCIRQNLRRPRKGHAPKELEGEADVAPALFDGVITDDPRLYLEVCEKFEDELDGRRVRPARGLVQRVRDGVNTACTAIMIQVIVMGFHVLRRAQGKFDYLEDRRSLDER